MTDDANSKRISDRLAPGKNDELMPKVDLWMRCSECHAAWVMMRRLSFTRGWLWVWGPECKCGTRKRPAPASPELVNEQGVVAT